MTLNKADFAARFIGLAEDERLCDSQNLPSR